MSISILWRRNDRPGHEFVRLHSKGEHWLVSGVAVFEFESRACCLTYEVTCDASWVTTGARVSGWIGSQSVESVVTVDGARSWKLNGQPCQGVQGSIDVDLNFSPSTNLLPIRRLNLALGESAEVHAAWLRFPSFTLEPLVQTYTRVHESVYRYESGSGRFSALLEVNEWGLPTSYGDVWTSVPPDSAKR